MSQLLEKKSGPPPIRQEEIQKEPGRRKGKAASFIYRNLIRLVLLLYSLVVIIPFVYLLLNTFKSSAEFYASIWALPSAYNLENYKLALQMTQLHVYALNTIVVVVSAVLLNLALGSMVSYVITRMRIRWGSRIYNYFLLGLLIPSILAVLPLFMVARVIGLYNTRMILILAYAVFELPFCVFVLTAFFKTLPSELEQAGMIDGAGYFATFFRIMLPLAKPGLITVGVFCFLDFWNEYILPLTLIADEEKKTVSMAILRLQVSNSVKQEWGALFAACVMIILPVLLIYGVFQRKLTEGLTAGSLKG